MKKLIFLVVIVFILTGCGSAQKMITGYNDVLKQIPNNEFTKFEYHRSGIYSTAHIVASDAAKDGDLLMIDNLYIQLNYGPENLTLSVEGYIREVEQGD